MLHKQARGKKSSKHYNKRYVRQNQILILAPWGLGEGEKIILNLRKMIYFNPVKTTCDDETPGKFSLESGTHLPHICHHHDYSICFGSSIQRNKTNN